MTDYIMSTTGDDADPGTLAEPWLTLAYALTQLSAGDTLGMRAGTYNEGENVISISGSAGNEIIFYAYNSEAVIWQSNTGDYTFDITGDYIELQELDVDKEDDDRANVRLDGDHCAVRDCTIRDTEYVEQIWIRGSDCEVTDCQIHDNYYFTNLDAHNILVASVNNTISNTVITGNTMYGMTGDGVQVLNAANEVIGSDFSNNTIYGPGTECAENAFDIKEGTVAGAYNYIEDNTVYGYRHCTATCGGSGGGVGAGILIHDDARRWYCDSNEVYDCTTGIAVTDGAIGIYVRNNLIYRTNDDDINTSASAGIYVANVSFSIQFINNTLVDCGNYYSGGERSWFFSSCTCTVQNNITYNGYNIYQSGTPTITYNNNCWYNCNQTLSGVGDVTSDPLFANYGGDDFHLTGSSPCIGAGDATNAPAEDKDDETRPSPPSIGAYEFVAGIPPIVHHLRQQGIM